MDPISVVLIVCAIVGTGHFLIKRTANFAVDAIQKVENIATPVVNTMCDATRQAIDISGKLIDTIDNTANQLTDNITTVTNAGVFSLGIICCTITQSVQMSTILYNGSGLICLLAAMIYFLYQIGHLYWLDIAVTMLLILILLVFSTMIVYFISHVKTVHSQPKYSETLHSNLIQRQSLGNSSKFTEYSRKRILSAIDDINTNTKWSQNGIIVAGQNGQDKALNQLSFPSGICVDDTGTVYVTEWGGHRVTKWKSNTASDGQIVAGGNRQGGQTNQLSNPTDVIIDNEQKNLIICDRGNRRVVKWSLHNGTYQETIISNIECNGLAMDNRGFLYVSDTEQSCVKRWRIGDTQGKIVAGGNKKGNRNNQLNDPYYICVDQNYSLYVSDNKNHRVMKWDEGAKEGVIVAGFGGQGNELTKLSDPLGITVDNSKTIYVSDAGNARVVRWHNGATRGCVVVGGNGTGPQNNQLSRPNGLSFDQDGNLYIVEEFNHRVQKFKKA